MFKAQFFPNSSIMEAKDSRGGSYAWRSILKGRYVIQKRSRWRVGDGKSINIWQHRWIPRKNSSLVASYPIESMENCSVAVLIDENERRWNEEVIDGILSLEEGALIKKIPLSRRVAEDVLVWPYTHRMDNIHVKRAIGSLRKKLRWILCSWTQVWIQGCGKEFGLSKFPTRLKTCYGGLVEVLYQQKKH